MAKLSPPYEYQVFLDKPFKGNVTWQHRSEEGDSVYKRDFNTVRGDFKSFLIDRYGVKFASKLVKELETKGEIIHRLKNPSIDEVAQIAKGFHGRDVREEFEVEEKETYHKNLAQLGELVELEIITPSDRNGVTTLEFNRKEPVRVCVSKDRKQIEFVGGDQEVEDEWLEKKTKLPVKDKVDLGECFSISYFADKHHLTGPKQQKYGTEYIHEFGEQGGVKPRVVYDRLNCRFLLVGGSYEVRDEGIYN